MRHAVTVASGPTQRLRDLSMRRDYRYAFSLVELLAVISIIGLLVALTLPAIQSARESARKSQCANNLKQVGLAIHNHIAAHKSLPAGYESSVTLDGDDGGPGWAWGSKLLPYLEESPIHQLIERKIPVDAIGMQHVREKSIPTFRCPSDDELGSIVEIPEIGTDKVLCDMAAASYVGSAGTVRPTCKFCRDRFDGVFGRNQEIQPRELEDGLSQTLAVGERATKWASATMWGVVPRSKLLDRQQPGKYAAGPAYVLGTTFADGFNIEELPETDENTLQTYAESFGSYHPGGCHFAFCDGGVRFVFDDVDPRTMNALATRAGIAKGGNLVDPIVHSSPF